jgi:SAM-dependent methyltransferase
VTGDTRSRHQVAAAYDHWAAPYAELFGDPARNHPWDRAAMTVLAEAVGDGVPGPVVDLGCGPGHWTAYLAAAGLDVHGVDLSADFVAHARATYPDLRFEHRSMTRTGLPDHGLRGGLAWFSLIHLEPAELPPVLAELRRLFAVGAPLLVGFQTTDEVSGPPAPYAHTVAPAHRWPVDTMAEALAAAGFTERSRLVRRPEPTERCPQAALLVRAS